MQNNIPNEQELIVNYQERKNPGMTLRADGRTGRADVRGLFYTEGLGAGLRQGPGWRSAARP